MTFTTTVAAAISGTSIANAVLSSAGGCTPTSCTPPVNPAHKFAITKTLKSINGGAATAGQGVGPNDVLVYNIAVTNNGAASDTTTLTETVPTDTTYTGSGEGWGAGCVAATTTCTQSVTVAAGATSNVTFTTTVAAAISGTSIANTVVSDAGGCTGTCAVVTPFVARAVVLKKTANVSTAKRGDVITYTITATNVAFDPIQIVDTLPAGLTYANGSAKVSTATSVAPIVPTISGNRLTFNSLHANTGKITVVLNAVVSATAQPGSLVNTAQIINPATNAVLATAKASVEILPDATFDCSDIIGKVFDDKNRNGYPDEGEPGLPGVRVATVNGTLITTDAYGRFHIGCAALPNQEIGSNFILKLDERTLPAGYHVTTENPKTIRLTAGKMTKLNFGAAQNRVIRLDLTDAMFAGAPNADQQKLDAVVAKLVGILAQSPSNLKVTYYESADGHVAASKRLETVLNLITTRFSKQSTSKLSVESLILSAQ